jgi:glycosyltransferase involved in cell wall biosynthesis
METLKFLMITTHYPPQHIGGDAVMVEYLSRELIKRGHEVHIFHSPSVYETLKGTSSPRRLIDPENTAIKHAHATRWKRLDALSAYSLGSSRKAITELNDLVRNTGPDVVHWHNTKAFIGQAMKIGGACTLMTTHDYFPICPRTNLLNPRNELCDKPRMCQLCLLRWGKLPQPWRIGKNRVIRYDREIRIYCPSQFMRERLRSQGVSVAGVLKNFAPDPEVESPTESGVRPDLVYVGILEPHKGPRTLLEAFLQSMNSHEFNLHYVGDGSEKRLLQERVAELGLENRIAVHGYTSRRQLRSILAGASALMVPSEWYENAPLVALEAYALGVPVIGARIGGLPEIVDLQPSPMTFRPGDAKDLARIIIEFWSRREDIEKLRPRIKDIHKSSFSCNSHLDHYFRIIAGNDEVG